MTLAQMESRFFELKGKLAVGQITEDELKRELEKLRFQDQEGRWWMIGAQSGRWYYYDGARWLIGQPPALSPPDSSSSDAVGSGQVPSDTQTTTTETTPISQPPKTPYYVPPPQNPTATPGPRYTPPPQATGTSKAVPSDEQAARANPAAGLAPRSRDASTHPPTLAERVRGEVPHVHVPSVQIPPMHVRPVHAPMSIRRYSPNTILFGAAVIGLLLVALLWLAVDNLVPGKPISTFFGKSLGIGAASVVTTPTARATSLIANANVDNLLRVGDELVAKNQFDAGMTQYQSASKLEPTDADIYIRWSRALALAGRIQEAIGTAQRATRLDSNSADAFAQLARALAWSGQNDAAVSAGETAIALDAKNATAHAFLAEAYLRGGQQTEAQKEATAALNLDDSNADAHRATGWVALIAGRKDEALAEWQRVVQIEPNIFFYHFELGQVYGDYLNDPASAIP
jgi:hypothetical protein